MKSNNTVFPFLFEYLYNFEQFEVTTENKKTSKTLIYRSGTVNSNTVNSKFHLIRSFFEIFARFLSFHV